MCFCFCKLLISIINYQDIHCTAFQFKNKECKTCKTGKIKGKDEDDIISGLCPKVKVDLERVIKKEIENIDEENWWCEKNDNTKKCNFPFKINGQNYFKPFSTTDGDKKCIIADDTYNFNESQLVPCSPCPGIITTLTVELLLIQEISLYLDRITDFL